MSDADESEEIYYFSVCLYKTFIYEVPAESYEAAIVRARAMFDAGDMGVSEPFEESDPSCDELADPEPYYRDAATMTGMYDEL